MGILERIEEKLDLLLGKSTVASSVEQTLNNDKPVVGVTPVGSNAEATPAGVVIDGRTPVPPTTTTTTGTATDNTVAVELDVDGCPWDARIHAGTKTKTVKGIWKAKKGADKDQVAAIKAELIAAHAGQTPVAGTATPPPAAGTATPPPAAGTATPPPAAGTATPPVENEFKAKAIAEFNRLDKEFGVDYDSIVEVLEQFGGAKTFNDLVAEHYQGAWTEMKAWADWLHLCNTEIAGITAVIGVDATPARVATICSNWGVDNIAGVHFAECNALHDKLKADRESLETWKASQG